MTADFEIVPQKSFSDEETVQAKSYWSQANTRFYKKKQVWSEFIAQRILAFDPVSVFEFGCNVGKNLLELQERDDRVHISGVDINQTAIEYGRSVGLNVAVGDETVLNLFPGGCFDVTFTVSVIDHLPYPGPIVANLARMTRKAVLLMEPWLGEEGKVVRNRDRKTHEMIDTTPFSYSWNYPAIVEEYLPEWSLEREDYKIETNIGRYYQLYTLTPKSK